MPIFRGLFIDVVCATLAWGSSRHYNNIACFGECIHEYICKLFWEMFSNFETESDIVGALGVVRLSEVVYYKVVGRHDCILKGSRIPLHTLDLYIFLVERF
jgi:hypothetical protein